GISKEDAKMLRRQKLVEGRYPNIYVASHLAISTDKKAQYIKNRAFDDAHYKDLVIQYLRKYGEASRQDIDALLMDKLSNVLSREQKENKIRNLLHQMSKQDRSIRNIGAGRRSIWVLNLDKKDVS
ncbi:MAG: transcriptional regulator, partial [bacterium]